MNTATHIVYWLIMLELLAVPGFLIARRLFAESILHAGLAPVIALGLTAWLVWFFGMVFGLPFTAFSILTVALLVTAAAVSFTKTIHYSEWIGYLKVRCFFIVFFLLFLLYRSTRPLDFGVEAHMDMAFLTAISRTESLPPYDPFMAGKTINYYYFGYLVWAMMSKLTRISTTFGYQFALASQYAMSLSVAYAAAFSLARSRTAGLLALLVVGLLGNLHSFLNLFGNIPFHYWDATRQIPGAATEFPAFIFTLGNLHPHLMDIPYALTLLITIVFWARTANWFLGLLITLFLTVTMLTNMWDFLAYAVVAVAFAIAHDKRRMLLIQWLSMLILAAAMTLPFYLSITPAISGLAWVKPAMMTPLSTFLVLYGPFFLAAIWDARSTLFSRHGLTITGASLVPALALHSAAIAFLVTLAGCHVLNALRTGENKKAISVIFVCALGLLIGSEIIFIDDRLGGINERFNTVFKFHFAALNMLAVATAVVASSLKFETRPIVRNTGIALTTTAILAMSVWPLRTISGRIKGFLQSSNNWTLDGGLYLNKGERAIVNYLKAQPKPPIIAEASLKAYSRQGRISTFSGAPGVLVWWNHELTWRGDWKPLAARKNDLEKLFKNRKVSIINKRKIDYIVSGPLEEKVFGKDAGRNLPGTKLVLNVGNHRLYRTIRKPRSQ